VSTGYIGILSAELLLRDNGSLKGKRKEVSSLKTLLRQRFGAAVAETDGHDTWQRTTLLCALVGDSEVEHRADALIRFAEARCPDGCRAIVDLRSLADLRG